MTGTLYIVATPIGNLEDVTLRALRILKEVNLIAAEDTRHTQTLLRHYDIRTPLVSYHEHNERAKAQELVADLLAGKNVALVSDAGTPAVSDPGYRLVVAAVAAKVNVVPIPGASASVLALSASGLPTDRFAFEGFLPAKTRERRSLLQALRVESRTLLFYEAPHRLADSLRDLQEILGDREIVIARELTKLHEEFLRGRVSEVLAALGDQAIRGEITLVVRGASEPGDISKEIIQAEIAKLKADGVRVKEIAEIIGEKYGLAKREVYRLALDIGSR
ncbi:MAG: 16S rRNA (cytidine(1402)-2'-O)-methyltransferase [Deltaproteobacteria bacterium]|nr:16S rRNA (cytidine(1402)-2'-O)-methyltransferase [Deltaproteobacteria bacterium]